MKYRMQKVSALLLAGLLLTGCQGATGGDYAKGAKELAAGNYEKAETYFNQGLEANEDMAENYRGLGIASFELGDYDTAATMLNQSLQSMKSDDDDFTIDVYYYLGDTYMAKGELVRAVETYTSLLDYTHTAKAYEKRAAAYLKKDDTERGLEDLDKAVDLDDGYDVYWNVYSICQQYGQDDKGEAYLKEALEEDTSGRNEPEDCFYRGLMNYTLGYYDDARDELLTATKKDYDEATLLLGKVYLAMEDTTSAASLYQDYLEQHEDSVEAYSGLSLCAISDKDYDQAMSYIEKGLDCDSEEDKQPLLYNQIVVYEYQLDFDKAKSCMEAYLEKYPSDAAAIRENEFLESR